MLTLTVQGADYTEIKSKLAAMFEPEEQRIRVESVVLNPEVLANWKEGQAPVTMEPTTTVPTGKRGRPKKETTVEAALPPAEAPAPIAQAVDSGAASTPAAVPPGGAPVVAAAIEPTEENMRKLLQTFVGKAKTADAGAEEVGKMFVKLFGTKDDGSPKILRVKDVPADRRADVIAEVQKAMAV